MGVFGAVLSFAMSQFLMLLASFYFLKFYYNLLLPSQVSMNYAKDSLIFGLKGHISNVLSFINYRIDIFIIAYFLDDIAVGIYSVAVLISERIWLVSQSVSSVLFALWFAERLSKPIGRLAAAAKRVGAGELTTQVIEDEGDDEIAQLGRYFNQMTKQLKHQRDTLVDNTQQIEERRRLFDSVLSSVTSGVIVLNPDGQVNFTNNSANVLLNYTKKKVIQNQLSDIFPELNSLFRNLKKDM